MDASETVAAQVNRFLVGREARPETLLPLLHDIQDALGYVPSSAVPLIAKTLGLSRAEIHGVITYYHHFRQEPPGRHVVRVCRAEACQAVGGEVVAARAAHLLAGKDITLENAYCLGLCACGPAVQVDETTLLARVTVDDVEALVAALDAAPEPQP